MRARPRKMIRQRPSLRIGPCLAVLVAGLVVAIALPVEPGAGQTPPPAPDPVPDANPTPPPSGGSSGGGGGGDSPESPDSSGGGDSSGSSSGSTGASSPSAGGGPESSTSSQDEEEPEPKAEPKREKQQVEKPDREGTAAPDARDPPARPAGMALGVGTQPNGSPADLKLFVLALAGALAIVLLLLAATPPRLVAGVSVTLAARQRKVELGIAAVLLSLVFGLLAAQCGANLR
jgi:hypothetical protein